MRTQRTVLLALLGCLLLLSPAIRASDEDAEDAADAAADAEEVEEDVPASEESADAADDADDSTATSHPDVTTSVVFPKYAEKTLPFETLDVLIGFQNGGQKTFNLTSVYGSLNSPFDYSYYITNFTVDEPTDLLVGPGEQTTLHYKFNAELNLEAMDFQLALSVAYEDEDKERFVSVAMNETTRFYEPASEINAKQLFTYAAIVAVMALVAVFVSRSMDGGKGGSAKNGAAAGDDNWLPAVITKEGSKRRVAGKSSKSNKKKQA